MRWYYILRHVGFAHLRWLSHRNKPPVNNSASVANFYKVLCAACEFDKASKRLDGATKINPMEDKQSKINKLDLFLGQRVTGYHYQLDVTDRIYSSRGRNYNPRNMYCGGSVFTDYSSGYISCKNKVSLSESESIKAKLKY